MSCSRDGVISAAAQELEFSALSLCSTVDGYGQRTTEKIEGIHMLAQSGFWNSDDNNEDFEDGKEVVEIMRRLSGNRKR